MSNQSYIEIAAMPVQRFYNYVKWKADLEDERRKQIAEGMGMK